jgi:hypothetical protein
MNGLQTANAFVVLFRGEATATTGNLCGRVEHVASGRTAIFQRVDDLPAVLQRMLKEAQTLDTALEGGRPSSDSRK